jgi:hypothetical protein
MECQNRTISRGSSSIFSRLRKEGIDVSYLTGLPVSKKQVDCPQSVNLPRGTGGFNIYYS